MADDPAPLDKLTTQRKPLEVKAVADKLRKCHGNQAAVARHFGVTRQAVNSFVLKRKELVAACRDAREAMKDLAESQLHRALRKGEAWSVCFTLKTIGRDRGYSENSAFVELSEQFEKFVTEVRSHVARRDAPN